MKNYLKTLTIITLLIFTIPTAIRAQPSFEEEMKKAAIQVNQMCPMMVDDLTQLDSASVSGPTKFQYYYTLKGISKSDLDIGIFIKNIEPTLIAGVRDNPALKIYRDNKVTMIYTYFDKDSTLLTSISVTPAKYKSE